MCAHKMAIESSRQIIIAWWSHLNWTNDVNQLLPWYSVDQASIVSMNHSSQGAKTIVGRVFKKTIVELKMSATLC